MHYGKVAVRIFAAIHSSARKQTCELSDGDAEKLFMEDMFQPLIEVGEARFQPFNEPLRDLPEENARLAGRVQECGVRVAEQLLRQHVQHPVYNFGRRENLIVGKISKAVQHIGIVNIVEKILSHRIAPSDSAKHIVSKTCLRPRKFLHRQR